MTDTDAVAGLREALNDIRWRVEHGRDGTRIREIRDRCDVALVTYGRKENS